MGLINAQSVQRRVAATSLTPHLLGVHGWLGNMHLQIQSQSQSQSQNQNQNFRCFFLFSFFWQGRRLARVCECPILVQCGTQSWLDPLLR